jgi:lipoprotein-releasing system ATP-binding protein
MFGSDPLLRAKDLVKAYKKHKLAVPVLRGLDVDVHDGEFLSIIGMSGSGKSTLLHLLGTLDQPDSGSVHLEGRRIDHLPSQQRDKLRNQTFGFIFQFYHLLPELSTLENVLMPLMIRHSFFGWMSQSRALKKKAAALLDRVGLSHRLKHRPTELSGGEMQRAAIARALINEPRVLLADEPTGNLDSATGKQIVQLLRELNRDDRLTIVMVTHSIELAGTTDRTLRLIDGRFAGDPEPGAVPQSDFHPAELSA